MNAARYRVEGAVACAVAGIALYLLVKVPDYVSGWSLMLPGTTDRSLSPTFFPRVAFGILFAVAVVNGVVSLRTASRGGDVGRVDPVPVDAVIHSPVAAAGWMLVFGAYLATMWALGFYLASAALVLLLGFLCGYRKNLILVFSAILLPAAVEFVFLRGLSLRLPKGNWLDFSILVFGGWG